jgi:protein-L-isoaspartate(D-aspartate) O-methyltransferase
MTNDNEHNNWKENREHMVTSQIEARGISDAEILKAMLAVERHLFVPELQREFSYEDKPLPIGDGQTISQPYIVALMTSLLMPVSGMKILEIGTGSGYQTAILSFLGAEIWSLEIREHFTQRAKAVLDQLGFHNIHLKTGDGYIGWPQHAPYDAIIVACAPTAIPDALKVQLSPKGRIVIPVGSPENQELVVVSRIEDSTDEWQTRKVIPVRFVPMVS